ANWFLARGSATTDLRHGVQCVQGEFAARLFKAGLSSDPGWQVRLHRDQREPSAWPRQGVVRCIREVCRLGGGGSGAGDVPLRISSIWTVAARRGTMNLSLKLLVQLAGSVEQRNQRNSPAKWGPEVLPRLGLDLHMSSIGPHRVEL